MLFSRKSESHHAPVPVPIDAREVTRERLPAIRPPSDGHIASPADGGHTQSFIDGSLTIVGDLHSAGDVRIDGRICGNVRCAQLILGRDAAITGCVIAEQAIVRGRVIGTIRAPVVIIQETAHVESEITYSSLSIDDGAFFEGAVRRRDNPLDSADPLPLLGLQHAADAAEPAPGACATKRAETATAARPTVSEPPPTNGKARLANGRAPMANARTPTG